MPPNRSAHDATRFTSTTPHASAKPPLKGYSASGAKTGQRKPGPVGETPQEKVRRLRAAADLARESEVSAFDKFLVRGRVWADRAHRFTALTLIACTGIAGVVTVYALGDMMIYNRKKRAEFYEEQKARIASAVHAARIAIDRGTATQEQIAFIQREDDHAADLAAAAKAKAEKKGIFGKSKDWLFSGLKKDEEGDDVGSSERRLGYDSLSEEDDGMGVRESDIVRALEDKKDAISSKARQAFADEKERQRTGGPLDRLGTSQGPQVESADDEQPKSGGWTSWMNVKR